MWLGFRKINNFREHHKVFENQKLSRTWNIFENLGNLSRTCVKLSRSWKFSRTWNYRELEIIENLCEIIEILKNFREPENYRELEIIENLCEIIEILKNFREPEIIENLKHFRELVWNYRDLEKFSRTWLNYREHKNFDKSEVFDDQTSNGHNFWTVTPFSTNQLSKRPSDREEGHVE